MDYEIYNWRNKEYSGEKSEMDTRGWQRKASLFRKPKDSVVT